MDGSVPRAPGSPILFQVCKAQISGLQNQNQTLAFQKFIIFFIHSHGLLDRSHEFSLRNTPQGRDIHGLEYWVDPDHGVPLEVRG